MRKDIRRQVCRANKRLGEATNLTFLRFGNVSEVDRKAGVVVIKPSGVPFDELKQKDMVAVSLESGEVVSGELAPSVDTATHLGLYNAFPDIGGICHTHSTNATMYVRNFPRAAATGLEGRKTDNHSRETRRKVA